VNWPRYGDPGWPRDARGIPLPPAVGGGPVWPDQATYDAWHRWYYGAPPPVPRSTSKTPPLVVAGAVVAGIAAVVLWAVFSSSGGSSSNPDNHVTGTNLTSSQIDGAYESCKGAVNSQLKAPATASYPNFATNTADIHIVNNGGGDYTIRSQVDSENGFGAKLRTFFTCDAQTSDGTAWAATATLTPQ
jgi:hypothetical protein